MAASRRAYKHYCALARALDLVGERWTLLVVRDLLLGPKRFRDLLEGLPGIGTNLLTTRLRELEAAGLVERRVLAPPAGSTVYALTEAGQALEPVALELGLWGARYLGVRAADERLVPTPIFLGMRTGFKPGATAGAKETYEVRVGNRVFEVGIDNGKCRTSEGGATNPDVVLSLDVETLYELLIGAQVPDDAVQSGRAVIECGDDEALARFIELFAFAKQLAA
jgi:DNA-binding HxlR family transcriptional regulator